jgi:hypothetical protein
MQSLFLRSVAIVQFYRWYSGEIHEEQRGCPLLARRVISRRCGIWSLPEHSGHWSSLHQSGSIYEYAP